jgi:hypothetical protein
MPSKQLIFIALTPFFTFRGDLDLDKPKRYKGRTMIRYSAFDRLMNVPNIILVTRLVNW